MTMHVLRRQDLPENGVVIFDDPDGGQCVVADIDGDVHAFALSGPAAARAALAVVAEGRLRCPLHGWPIDATDGRCGAAERCSYRPLLVEVSGDVLRVTVTPGSPRASR